MCNQRKTDKAIIIKGDWHRALGLGQTNKIKNEEHSAYNNNSMN